MILTAIGNLENQVDQLSITRRHILYILQGMHWPDPSGDNHPNGALPQARFKSGRTRDRPGHSL